MELDDHTKDMLLRLCVSLAIGFVIGAEREYRNKSAGLRTIILICLGSTLFTMISFETSHPSEVGRIASNIVTGIGFLGAGAIMRDGLSVSGLTTASAIWVAAALGMAVGVGEFRLSIFATLFVMTVLIVFNYLQRIFDRLHKLMMLRVIFNINRNGIVEFEEKLRELRIRYDRVKERRNEEDVNYEYQLSGNSRKLEQLIQYLVDQKEQVKSFEY